MKKKGETTRVLNKLRMTIYVIGTYTDYGNNTQMKNSDPQTSILAYLTYGFELIDAAGYPEKKFQR